MGAAFKVLKKIYLSFPEVWDIFEQKKSKKSLLVEKNPALTAYKLLEPEVLN